LNYIELTLDDSTKVKVGTETAAITTAVGAATFGTIINGAQLIEFNGKGRFLGLKVKTQNDASSNVDVMMGVTVLHNSTTKCDISNGMRIVTDGGTTLNVEAMRPEVVKTHTIGYNLMDAFGISCPLATKEQTNYAFLQ